MDTETCRPENRWLVWRFMRAVESLERANPVGNEHQHLYGGPTTLRLEWSPRAIYKNEDQGYNRCRGSHCSCRWLAWRSARVGES